jgi:hypothetical protein
MRHANRDLVDRWDSSSCSSSPVKGSVACVAWVGHRGGGEGLQGEDERGIGNGAADSVPRERRQAASTFRMQEAKQVQGSCWATHVQ